ncbi:hypothetical protein E4T44_06056 [Aureobasidium sp. EXF-8845]|nr:hypothetical protein E4T44_06056 [Aureobasidium sp. EXF-8845]KAI4847461.1 hypothetical protein E4T45_06768 [Aureobasidium sp. EXF-8846]
MAPQIAEIIKDSQFDPTLVDRIAFREVQPTLEVLPYNPEWPRQFAMLKEQIITALGNDIVVAVNHVGSTSVPGLPAKDIIDIDLVVRDVTKESEEPHWHQHRFFYTYNPYSVNLHVWGPDCPEVTRHQIFRQRLLDCPEDMALYLKAKQMAAERIGEVGGNMQDYNDLKEDTIRKILRNAFKDLGYIS